jgi:methylthioribulose-1-phosphate dehydratase
MDQRGWVPATAGNLSIRIGDQLAITCSGGHKGFLEPSGLMLVDQDGAPRSTGKPSAETLLHCQIYRRFPQAAAVLHGHSVPATVLSMIEERDAISFSGYEVQKAFEGQTTHEAKLDLPLFPNDQDIPRLARTIEPRLEAAPLGYLIRGHGVYVWGAEMDIALARLEGLEFLLACALERRKLRS